MNLAKTKEKINEGRHVTEACFVFSVWNDPDLYIDYPNVNNGKDKTLINPDAIFYWGLGRAMYNKGIKKFDAISIEEFLTDRKEAKKKYEEYGGYKAIQELTELTYPENINAYYDTILKKNALCFIAEKYEETFENVDKFKDFSSEDVYNAFELLNNQVAVNTSNDSKVEDLVLTKEYFDDCKNGTNVGLQYNKAAPLLNYTTLGLPLGDVYMLAGHSGSAKSSWVFENIVLPVSQETPTCIFSNEMQIAAYQNMLAGHILTKDIDYWKLTRKKIKIGKYTEEDEEAINKAIEKSNENHNIKFVKLFDNDTSVIMKYMKQLANKGVRCFVWDTYKNDDVSDGSDAWLQLLMNSRKIFNLTSKLNVSLVLTFQLALYTTNQRYLDAGCLSSSKQIKEVISELLMIRRLWKDEYTGEKYDCKPYRFNRDNHKIKEEIDLDPEKTYFVVFINKTRNDESNQEIIFEWQGQYNRWKELGYCTIKNDHRGY